MDGIERYELEQKHARLLELRAKLARKLGLDEAMHISSWYRAVHNVGCPNCGLDFTTSVPETNLWPHYNGECAKPKQRGER